MRTGILLFLIGLLSAAPASAVIVNTLDFEEPIDFQGPGTEETIFTQGYNMTSSGGFLIGWGTGGPNDPPTDAVSFCGACGTDLERADGKLFDLISFEHGVIGDAGPYTLTITGFYVGGQSVTVQFDSFELISGVTMGSGWTGLERIVFSHSTDPTPFAGYLDNIQVSTIPIPAAAWLFASGLGLLGWRRKRS